MPLNPPPIQNAISDSRSIVTQPWILWFNSLIGRGFDNTVIVKKASDLRNIDSTKNYMIDGSIDMGDLSIEIPEGGISISGLNGARDTSKLISSSDNYTLFISPSGGYSGDVVLESCTIEITGSSSKVFDLDNDGNSSALDITGVNFTSCTSLGELTDYRQLLMNNVGFIFIDDGLQFNGTWTGITITTSIAVGFPAATLLKEGTTFTINNLRSDMNFLSVNSASVFCDFVDADITSDGGFSLTNFRSGASDALPNIDSKAVTSRIRDCNGVDNTFVGSGWKLTTETATSIASSGVAYKVSGTTTAIDNQWFDQPTSNQTRMISSQNISVKAECRVSMSGSNGNQIKISVYKYDDSTSSFSEVGESPAFTMNASGRAESVAFDAFADLSENDYLEMRVKNTTNSNNVTLLEDSTFFVTERPS